MKQLKTEDVVKKFRTMFQICLWSTVGVSLVLMMLLLPYLGMAALALPVVGAALFGTVFMKRVKRNTLDTVLFRNMDPEGYLEILYNTDGLSAPAEDGILASLFSGDYPMAIQLCQGELQRKFPFGKKLFCTAVLCRAYFETEDFSNLKTACDSFDAYLRRRIGGSALREKYFIPYYQAYAENRFADCIDFCTHRQYGCPFEKANGDFHLAAAYYRSGDREKAAKYFASVKNIAPYMQIGRLSRKYLSQMEKSACDPS